MKKKQRIDKNILPHPPFHLMLRFAIKNFNVSPFFYDPPAISATIYVITLMLSSACFHFFLAFIFVFFSFSFSCNLSEKPSVCESPINTKTADAFIFDIDFNILAKPRYFSVFSVIQFESARDIHYI